MSLCDNDYTKLVTHKIRHNWRHCTVVITQNSTAFTVQQWLQTTDVTVQPTRKTRLNWQRLHTADSIVYNNKYTEQMTTRSSRHSTMATHTWCQYTTMTTHNWNQCTHEQGPYAPDILYKTTHSWHYCTTVTTHNWRLCKKKKTIHSWRHRTRMTTHNWRHRTTVTTHSWCHRCETMAAFI